jgi:arylamine N-acetyltransferase
MVNLVKIDGKRYFVDVAFGSDGPAQPMPLESGYECAGAGPQRQRLEHKALPIHSDPDQRAWVYSCRRDDADDWKTAYSFVDVEFFPQDFEVINLSVMTRPQSFFKQNVVCTNMLEDPETKCLIGNLSLLNGEVRRRVGLEITVLEKFTSEGERVAGLEKWFGIVLTEEEQKGITGLATELSGTEGSAIVNL